MQAGRRMSRPVITTGNNDRDRVGGFRNSRSGCAGIPSYQGVAAKSSASSAAHLVGGLLGQPRRPRRPGRSGAEGIRWSPQPGPRTSRQTRVLERRLATACADGFRGNARVTASPGRRQKGEPRERGERAGKWSERAGKWSEPGMPRVTGSYEVGSANNSSWMLSGSRKTSTAAPGTEFAAVIGEWTTAASASRAAQVSSSS